MPDSSYCVLDAEEVSKMFSDMDKRLKRQVLRRALVAAMAIIKTEIENACPVQTDTEPGSDALPPGALKAAIRVRTSTSSDGLKGSSRLDFGDQNIIAARVEHGHLLFGHLPGHKDLGVVVPHPFIWPAVDRSLDKAMAAYQAAVEEALIEREGIT